MVFIMNHSLRSILQLPLPVFLAALLILPPLQTKVEAQQGYQRQLLRLHNRERARRNIRPLRLHGALNRASIRYARVMNANDHWSHTGPDGSTVRDRVEAECATCFRGWGENLAKGQRNPAQATRAWMQSPGHRRNILRRSFRRVGFGRAGSAPYWVAKFGA